MTSNTPPREIATASPQEPTTAAPHQVATPTPGLSTRQRVRGIDVLRGLAVILVMLNHIHLRFEINDYDVDGLLPGPLSTVLFWSGHEAVVIFFVISGFLITSLSLRRWGSLEKIELSRFYRLRGARILPCLLLLLTVLSVLHAAGAADFTIEPERASLGRALLAALTFHFNWLEGQRGYLPGNWDVLWSLSVEETFYVVFPLMCLLLRNERWLMICIAVLIGIGPFDRMANAGRSPWDEYAYLSGMDGIAFGCIAAWITARVQLSRPVLRGAMALGIVATISIMVFRQQVSDLGLKRVGLDLTILEMGTALLLMALARGVGDATLSRGTALLRLAGRCSYEIYLTHMFVVFGAMHAFRHLFGAQASSPAIYAITYTIMLALSILLGYIVERLVSNPLNEALRGNYAGRATGLPESGAA